MVEKTWSRQGNPLRDCMVLTKIDGLPCTCPTRKATLLMLSRFFAACVAPDN
jgi:hypothetical protein